VAISFNEVPSAIRVPFVAVEIDASQASQGPALLAYRALLIGQKTASGSAAADSLHKVTNVEQVIGLSGRGSILHRMAVAWFASNTFTEVWLGVLDDDAAGTAAVGTITATGPATADGTIALYVGGQRVTVGVISGDSADDIATAIAAALPSTSDLTVTGAVDGVTTEEVDVTFRHKGLVGNSFNIRHSYRDGEELPAGVGLTIVQTTGGATNPTLTDLIAAMGDSWFQIIAHPYTDATSLTAIEGELSSRFGPMRMIDGLAITSAAGSHSTLTTLGDGRNSPHSVIVAQAGETPLTPPMEFAAEVAAIVARFGAADPARPFQTLAMRNALPPAESDLFTLEERNLQLFDGIATSRVGAGDVVQLDRIITTYQENAAGADDTAYLDATTLLTLLYLRYSFRVRMQARYPRHKLANDGTRFGSGQAVITPLLGKAEAVGWFREMETLGLVEGADQFKSDLVVERDASNPNRLNFLLPPDLINQLIVTAAQIQFRL
jgi:phage tail sheath gpL-like